MTTCHWKCYIQISDLPLSYPPPHTHLHICFNTFEQPDGSKMCFMNLLTPSNSFCWRAATNSELNYVGTEKLVDGAATRSRASSPRQRDPRGTRSLPDLLFGPRIPAICHRSPQTLIESASKLVAIFKYFFDLIAYLSQPATSANSCQIQCCRHPNQVPLQQAF